MKSGDGRENRFSSKYSIGRVARFASCSVSSCPPPVVAKKHHSDDDDVSRAAGAGCRVLKEGEGDGREDAYHAASVWGRGPDTETGAH